MTYEPQNIEAVRAYWASYQKLEQEGLVVGTALEDNREALALGQAWRRCEAALPEGWDFRGLSPLGFGTWLALAIGSAPLTGTCSCCGQALHSRPSASASGPTPTAALEALATKLEGMK